MDKNSSSDTTDVLVIHESVSLDEIFDRGDESMDFLRGFDPGAEVLAAAITLPHLGDDVEFGDFYRELVVEGGLTREQARAFTTRVLKMAAALDETAGEQIADALSERSGMALRIQELEQQLTRARYTAAIDNLVIEADAAYIRHLEERNGDLAAELEEIRETGRDFIEVSDALVAEYRQENEALELKVKRLYEHVGIVDRRNEQQAIMIDRVVAERNARNRVIENQSHRIAQLDRDLASRNEQFDASEEVTIRQKEAIVSMRRDYAELYEQWYTQMQFIIDVQAKVRALYAIVGDVSETPADGTEERLDRSIAVLDYVSHHPLFQDFVASVIDGDGDIVVAS